MGLVESIAGKVFHQLKYILGDFFGDAVCYRAAHKLIFEFRHDLWLLLSHRLPEVVGLVQGKSCQTVGYAHDLFLIQNHPVGLFQEGFKQRMEIGYLLSSVFSINKGVYHAALQGPGLYKATSGKMSANLSGFSFFNNSLNPRLVSTWKTPFTSPRDSSS